MLFDSNDGCQFNSALDNPLIALFNPLKYSSRPEIIAFLNSFITETFSIIPKFIIALLVKMKNLVFNQIYLFWKKYNNNISLKDNI